jgi:hypothetical protein
MNDNEMILACANAMDLDVIGLDGHGFHAKETKNLKKVREFVFRANPMIEFDPLSKDDQAMALIKKFNPRIERRSDGPWVVWNWQSAAHSESLNRAVCEFVAKMPRTKKK